MKIELVKTDVNDLAIGMYVSMLDRPWLETPFQFQGFYVKKPSEIEEIQKYCSYVYIDVAKEKPVEVQKIPTKKLRPKTHFTDRNKKNKRKLFNFFNKPKKVKDAKEKYNDIIGLSEELPAAREHYEQSTAAVKQVIQELQENGKLDFSTAKQAAKPLVESILRNRDAMAWLCLMRKDDEYTYSHSVSCAVWVTILGRHLGLDKENLQTLSLGGMLHDIGKTKIPKEIREKTSELTDDEQKIMQEHVLYGVQILKNTPNVHPNVISMVATHHERHNGGGYPSGLSGTSIPLYGRIAAIADRFDGMTSVHPYSQRMSTYECLRTFNQLSDVDFQREMVEQFIQAIGFFPTGTVVELSNGTVGIVMKQNSAFRLRPEIMLILDENKNTLDEFPIINLDNKHISASSGNSLWITRGLEVGEYGINPEDYFLQPELMS
jgi:putative nucleotidyltransferase with HDIG domain